MGNRRVLILVIAVALAGLTAFLTFNYANAADERAFDGAELVQAFLVKKDIPKGFPGERAVEEGYVGKESIPRKFLPPSGVTDPQSLQGRVALAPLAAGVPLVAGSFVEERERIIRQQQDSLRELSTPVLQVRERLLILPIIGVLDTARAHQLTDQLLQAIRTHRARVVVIDITGVPDVDEAVADHLVKTVDASRLMGAGVIITGLSSDIAQTLVTIGVDLGKMNTVGDLQGGIEEAERLLGFRVIRTDDA